MAITRWFRRGVALLAIALLLQAAPGGYAESPTSQPDKPSAETARLLEVIQSLQAHVARLEGKLGEMEARSGERFGEIERTLKGGIRKVDTPPAADAASGKPEASVGDALLEEIDTVSLDLPTSPLTGMTGTQATAASRNPFLLPMNPNISVIGDFVGNYARRTNTPGRNRIDIRELELAFQSNIDPYSRADVFLAVGDEGVEIEEGFATLLALPYGFQAKVGKFRNAVGRLNRIHGHELPQVDRPEVLTQFFGEEGLAETGIGISKILPLPWYSLWETEITNGDNEVLFGKGRVDRPLMVSHWKNFFNLTDNTNLEVGLTGAMAPQPGAADFAHMTAIAGVDVTYRWVPPRVGKGLTWGTEFLTMQRENADATAIGRDHLYGGYSYVEAQLTRRLAAGVRFDYTQIPNVAVADSLWAAAAYVNFWQSEFARLRLEYKHTFRDKGLGNDQIWLQYTATIGAHGAHPF